MKDRNEVLGVRVRSVFFRVTGRCGDRTFIYGACNRKRGHATDPNGDKYREYHAEFRRGGLWAEWL